MGGRAGRRRRPGPASPRSWTSPACRSAPDEGQQERRPPARARGVAVTGRRARRCAWPSRRPRRPTARIAELLEGDRTHGRGRAPAAPPPGWRSSPTTRAGWERTHPAPRRARRSPSAPATRRSGAAAGAGAATVPTRRREREPARERQRPRRAAPDRSASATPTRRSSRSTRARAPSVRVVVAGTSTRATSSSRWRRGEAALVISVRAALTRSAARYSSTAPKATAWPRMRSSCVLRGAAEDGGGALRHVAPTMTRSRRR